MTDICYREAEVMLDELANAIDMGRGRVKVCFSTTNPVDRAEDPKYGDHIEILQHDANADFSLLNSQGVVEINHNDKMVIGHVVRGTARICPDRKARAEIQIDKEYRHLLKQIALGEIPNAVSVGYIRTSIVRRGSSNGIPVLHFAWQPYEISILVDREPADIEAGIGRSKSNPMKSSSFDDLLTLALSGSRKTESDWSDYSLCECLDTLDKNPRGMVREADQTERIIGGDKLTGRWVPFQALAPRRRDTTMAVNVFGQGGALVESTMHYPIVGVLRNKVCALSLGARAVQGLQGAFVLPRATSATTPQALPETSALTASSVTFDNIGVGPKRIPVQLVCSLQWIKQTGPAAEEYLRQEISEQIGVFFDRLILDGQAGSEPVGIINTPGAGSVTYSGPATWQNVLLSEQSLAAANADISSGLGWAVSPLTRNRWKQISKITSTNYPSFIWQDGLVNEYPAIATNNLSNQNQSVFGNWSDLLVLIWGNGTEFLFDPYTQASTGKMVVTANFWANILIRHPQSFCVSADSAAQ